MAVNRFGIVTFGFDKPATFNLSEAISRAVYITFGLFNHILTGAAPYDLGCHKIIGDSLRKLIGG